MNRFFTVAHAKLLCYENKFHLAAAWLEIVSMATGPSFKPAYANNTADLSVVSATL